MMESMEQILKMNVLMNMKTGNVIFDMIIASVFFSCLSWIMNHSRSFNFTFDSYWPCVILEGKKCFKNV